MSKSNKTAIAYESFIAIAQSRSMLITKQAACTRIEMPSVPGQRVYVPNQKGVTFVDISNFLAPTELGVVNLSEDEFNGNVKQRIDWSQSPADILVSFSLVLDFMTSLPPVEKVKKEKKAATEAAVKVSVEDVQAALERRRALIEKVAAEKGVGISKMVETNDSMKLALDDNSTPAN